MNNAPLQVIIGVCPSKSNAYRISGNRLFKSPKLTAYERSFYLQCNLYRNANIDAPFEFEVDVYYPSMRSDLDNALKIQLDCLQHVKAITNDRHCMKIVARRFTDKENPRIEFRIIPLS